MADPSAVGNTAAPVDHQLPLWSARSSVLSTRPGVHRPSQFSVLLAGALPDCTGLTVCDAGSGAGLVTVAALLKGARHVVAQDRDPAALADTEENVQRLVGVDAGERLSLWRADWRQLGLLHCDLLAVNPPQRPSSVLPAVPVGERHLHDGGGTDGLAALRHVLAHASAEAVLSTATSLLGTAPSALVAGRYGSPQKVGSATLRHDAAWLAVTEELDARVDVLRFGTTASLTSTTGDRHLGTPTTVRAGGESQRLEVGR